jgi:hypothetical protein
MRAIDKFILHTVHNLFPINEYSEGEIKRLMDKFKEEADDLNIQISDDQLRKYIERFDQIKNSPKITDKDLRQYSLSKLIKLVTSSAGAETAPEEIDITPDVVYNENGLIIYNGSKEGNCLTFGRGESWCITRGSFGNYRYDDTRKNPTFYLVKDTNQQIPPGDSYSDAYRKSFFVVVVGNDNTYKVSDRTNNDVGGRGTEWDRWEDWSFVERHFPSVRGLQRVFKYIPLSTKEKVTQQYKNSPISITEWIKFPYNVKEQYLVVRKGQKLFSDIENDTFIDKYITKYPQIANFISVNFGIVPSTTLIRHLDKFSNQDTRSIIANMRDKVNANILYDDLTPFEAKKIAVKFDKVALGTNQKAYVTQDGKTIVGLTFSGNDLKMSLITEDDSYPDVKINKRTAKYLLEYPELDRIPFNLMMSLAADRALDSEMFTNYINKIKENPGSAIKVLPTEREGEELIVDTNNFKAYKISGNELIGVVPFHSDEVQTALSRRDGGAGYRNNLLQQFKLGPQELPMGLEKDNTLENIRAIPFDDRTWRDNGEGNNKILLTSDQNPFFFVVNRSPDSVYTTSSVAYGTPGNWRRRVSYFEMNPIMWRSYFTFLRATNQTFDDNALRRILGSGSREARKTFVEAGPPITAQNRFIPVVYNNTVYLINRFNPRDSLQVSQRRSGLIRASLTTDQANQMVRGMTATIAPQQGQAAAAAPAIQGQAAPAAGPRRGRPVGGGIPRQQQEPARPTPAPGQGVSIAAAVNPPNGAYNLSVGFNSLPRSARTRLSAAEGRSVTTNGNRGAARRDNLLAGVGRVVAAYEYGPSSVYIIRLASGRHIASIVIQPGNSHYVITADTSYQLNSPTELMALLNQQNIREAHRYFINDFLGRNPHMLDEFKSLLRKHIGENKNK